MNLDRPIGDIFVEEGYLTREQLVQILADRPDATERLGETLVKRKIITEQQRLKCEGLQIGIPFIDMSLQEIDVASARSIPHAVALRLMAVPVERTEVSATVAMANPLDLTAIDELSALMKRDIDPLLATEEGIREGIYRAFGAYDDLGELVGEALLGMDGEESAPLGLDDSDAGISLVELRDVAEGTAVIKLANALMMRAISMRASDIHIDPEQRRVNVRFRIDGLLQEAMTVPRDLQMALASRIKILANLDIAERRIPQDGRFTLMASQGEFDFRVSTYPTVHGETIVIRILDKNSTMIDLNRLGMTQQNKAILERRLQEPQGLILVTGPTGSGKTTTLYSALHHLKASSRCIITIEDPIEYRMEGIAQGNVNPRAGVTFASGLRAMLRQDPDVMFVGEVRDPETASTAIEASLTGHLVLTSLHANDSSSALTRLMDMGIESFLIASGVTCSVAQRLLRVNCPKCIREYTPDPELLDRLELPRDHAYLRGAGCEYCAKTGYRGRLGVYELLEVSAEIRKMIQANAPATELREHAIGLGMRTVREEAIMRILEGVSTVDEVLRVTADGR